MEEQTALTQNPSQTNSDFLGNMTSRLSQLLNQISAKIVHESIAAPISVKLDNTNYGVWSQVAEMYISAKDKLGYINREYA